MKLLDWYFREYLKIPMEMTVQEIVALNKKHSRTMTEIGDLCARVHGFRKIGRNDPCVCGSGKKWKKCCGR